MMMPRQKKKIGKKIALTAALISNMSGLSVANATENYFYPNPNPNVLYVPYNQPLYPNQPYNNGTGAPNTRYQQQNNDSSNVASSKSKKKILPIKTIVSTLIGATSGAFLGASAKNTGPGCLLGTLLGAGACLTWDAFSGTFKNFKNDKDSSTTDAKEPKDNNLKNPQPIQNMPGPNVNPYYPTNPYYPPYNIEPIYFKEEPYVPDPEYQDYCSKLKDLQEKYTNLSFDVKYSNSSSAADTSSRFDAVRNLEDKFLRSCECKKFQAENSYCLSDLLSLKYSTDKKSFNSESRNAVISTYLNEIPIYYRLKELKILLPRLQKCYDALLEYKNKNLPDLIVNSSTNVESNKDKKELVRDNEARKT